jgi:hypothetical protein
MWKQWDTRHGATAAEEAKPSWKMRHTDKDFQLEVLGFEHRTLAYSARHLRQQRSQQRQKTCERNGKSQRTIALTVWRDLDARKHR